MIANIYWAKLGPRFAVGESIIIANIQWLVTGWWKVEDQKVILDDAKLTHLIHYLVLPLSLSSSYCFRSHTFCYLVSLWHFGTLLWLYQLNQGCSNPALWRKDSAVRLGSHVTNITDIEVLLFAVIVFFRSSKDVTQTVSIKKCFDWCCCLWTQLPQPDSIWNRCTQ